MSKTRIAVVLDASGSMNSIRAETISALNKFIKEQKEVPGEASLSLAQFSSPGDYRLIRDAVPLADVAEITEKDYVPAGYTALLDAMGRMIDDTGRSLAAMDAAARPEKVVIVVMTDGQENASREYKREQVMEKVKHQTEKYNWQFLFLGAGQDAIAQAGALGVAAAAAMSYQATDQGVGIAMNSTSDAIRSFRSGLSSSVEYSSAHRSANGSD